MDAILLNYIGAAFLGGIILNVMPCVLPVLTMKVFHIIEHSGASPKANRIHGLAYAGGVMATFLIFALAVIAIRAGGDSFGWGMQFQSPAFVAVMTALIFAFGLNALGVFEFTISVGGGKGGDGYAGSFINGVVASIMSTPCSAPFLGSAAAFALGTGAVWWQTLLMFLVIGLGLAFPFLLISFVPAVGRMLPRPGAWMETFKMLMGFTLLAATIWLFSVLQSQISKDGVTWFLAFLLVLGMALWSVEHFGGLMHGLQRRLLVRGLAAGLVVGAGVWMIDLTPPARAAVTVADGGNAPVVVGEHINWAPFNAARVTTEGAKQRPVFMDFTADWCANCKANEKLFIETSRIREVLTKTDILPMKADMTNDDEEIERWLTKIGRSGIPAYVIFMPDGTHDLLPEAITTELLAKRLLAADKKYPVGKRLKVAPKPKKKAPKATAQG
ncbi:MAG: thioredoxin family protein [Myxococcales bacterium]|nr:thioredoxin family protein [Myxococcales bacterium]